MSNQSSAKNLLPSLDTPEVIITKNGMKAYVSDGKYAYRLSMKKCSSKNCSCKGKNYRVSGYSYRRVAEWSYCMGSKGGLSRIVSKIDLINKHPIWRW